MNFYKITSVRKDRPVRVEVMPEFLISEDEYDANGKLKLDMMIRGGKFYAIWDEKNHIWATNPKTVQRIIDGDINRYIAEQKAMKDPSDENIKYANKHDVKVIPMHMRNDSTRSWNKFLKYVDTLPDAFIPLDEKLTFKSTQTTKTDYASKRLDYDICDGDTSAYEELVSTLYEPEEREKFEWAIGCILAGDVKKVQKFIVFHGPMGTGKSTIMNLIESLFGGYGKNGYCAKINAQALVSGNVGFALTPFARSPLVGIDQDSKLSRIEDNTILNQIVSHDTLQIDQKFKDLYESSTACFLFMGTNEPVRITNSKSGVIRRLIDVEPTGRTISPETHYDYLVNQLQFERGAIAKHCLDVYKKLGRTYYSKYVPRRMMLRTDPFFNFMMDKHDDFKQMDDEASETNPTYVNGKLLWENYRAWCEDSGMDFKLKRFQVIDEAKSYFRHYEERKRFKIINPKDGKEKEIEIRNAYYGLREEKFQKVDLNKEKSKLLEKVRNTDFEIPAWLQMKEQHSLLDDELADFPAQYGDEKPKLYWKDTEKEINGKKVVIPGVKTKLKDLDTSKTHYVQMPLQMIQIDLDKKNTEGKKDFLLNVKAIVNLGLPPTYAERSKGGEGIHLAYYYDGDTDILNRLIEEDVEIKVQVGDFALRRRVSKCNNLPIAHISSGLPLRRKRAVINDYALKDAKHLHNKIMMALRKEVEPKATRTSMMYIRDSLKEAQEKNIAYDFQDLDNIIYAFAANSTNSKDFCLDIYKNLKLRWPEEIVPNNLPPEQQIVQTKWALGAPIVLFDIETFKNLLIIVYKEVGPEKKLNVMVNPKPYELESFINKFKLVGFNNRGYDNFIIWGAYMGYTNMQLYELSQEIIVGGNRNPLRDAANISYTDIFDYCSTKQSLKKWEVEIEFKRKKQIPKAKKLISEGKTIEEAAKEIDLPAEYLEAYLDGTLGIIGHKEFEWPWDQEIPEEYWDEAIKYCKNDVLATEQVWIETQADFKAREILAEIAGGTPNDTTNQLTAKFIFGNEREPYHQFVYPNLKEKFPLYRFEYGKSYYGDELIGEGGRVYANPGMYHNVKTFDVASMHPSSIIAENGFGPYTQRFKEIMDIRIAIKHKDFDAAKKMLDGKLEPYLNDPAQAKQLSFALKIAINSVYGLTAAKFQNKFKDPRNIDNWVAKRGALFMETLRLKVQAMGATVVHIKTDSIKIADPTPEVEAFILKYGKDWGYNFEVESVYERICLVNDAVYIARCSMDPENGDEAGHWTATGAQFQHPFVFKTLFSREPIVFEDLCEVKSVKTAMYLDMNEAKPNVERFEKDRDKIISRIKKLGKTLIDPETSEIDKEKIRAELDDLPKDLDILDAEIAKGHDYVFVGKTGAFCPVIEGKGGGELMRKGNDGKYGAVGGTKGYRWLESDYVEEKHYDRFIDMDYFRELADVAMNTIGVYGNFELFRSGDAFSNSAPTTVAKERTEEQAANPPWLTPCCSAEYEYCSDCPHYYGEQEHCCKLGYNVSNQIITN